MGFREMLKCQLQLIHPVLEQLHTIILFRLYSTISNFTYKLAEPFVGSKLCMLLQS
ncbi:hypothetical protein D3C74_501660 [compost metagenome]